MTSADYKLGAVAAKLDNFFRISDRGSTFWIEFTGGMTSALQIFLEDNSYLASFRCSPAADRFP